MDLLQCEVESFEEDETQETKFKRVLAIAIISLGLFFDFDSYTDHLRDLAILGGYVEPKKKGKDGSQFFTTYSRTASWFNDPESVYDLAKIEPVAMTEYAVRLANNPTVHVMQIDEGENYMYGGNCEFYQNTQEFVLNERPGRTHHSYIKGENVIDKINHYLLNAVKEPNLKVFQLPTFVQEADLSL